MPFGQILDGKIFTLKFFYHDLNIAFSKWYNPLTKPKKCRKTVEIAASIS